MVEFVIGTDIFRQEGDLYLITVNCVGVMGKGLAKSFKEAHPDLYERYRHDCRMKIITIGNPVIYQAENGKRYMMFPTKERWQDPSLPEYISAGLQWMVDSVTSADNEEGDIEPTWRIVIPPLGCANGGLSFNDVKESIKLFGSHMPNPIVVVYPPWMEQDDKWD